MTHARKLPPSRHRGFVGPADFEGPYPTTGSQSSPILVAIAAFTGIAAVVAVTARHEVADPGYAVLFCVLIAAGEAARVRLPGGREAAPLGVAVALAYAVLTEAGPLAPTLHNTAQAITVAACGLMVGSVPYLASRRPTTLDYPVRRFLAVTVTAVLFRLAYLRDWNDLEYATLQQIDHKVHTVLCVVIMTGTILAGLLTDAVLGALIQAGRFRRPFNRSLRDELRFTVGIGTAVGATALLIGLACRAMNVWVLPVLCVPLVFTQVSMRRYARIRSIHLETIRALSRITDVAGLTERGHARRVARMAQRIGRELGLSESELLDLEYAALMHDIGQLSRTDPVFGGRTSDLSPPEQRELAQAGAEVIRSTGALESVAEIVGQQAEPYRSGGPLGSRILRVANAYDDLAGAVPEAQRQVDALDRIREGLAVSYDPAVVESLTRIVLSG